MNLGATKRPLVAIALILGLWTLLLLAFAAQLVFTAGLSWEQAFSLSLRDWYPWALFAPMVAWLSGKFPLERKELALSIPVHVAACILVVLACELMGGRPTNAPGPPGVPGQFRYRGGINRDGMEPPSAEARFREEGRQRPPRFQGTDGEEPQPPPLEAARPFLPNPGAVGWSPPEARRGAFVNALVMRAKFNIPIYWIIVSIVHALRFQRRSEERERRAIELEARLSATRLQALRAQLHPHFLFNTLNAIATLVHRDPKTADEMIVNLSDLLRLTLDTPDQEITLKREFDLLSRYLEIQKVRFGDRLTIAQEVEPETYHALVPTFLLQPIVENAIRHGIEPKPGPGILKITSQRFGTVLRIAVHDNGAGLKSLPPAEGLGLTNVRDRLRELYGNQGKLDIRRSQEASGCSVCIELPFRTALNGNNSETQTA